MFYHASDPRRPYLLVGSANRESHFFPSPSSLIFSRLSSPVPFRLSLHFSTLPFFFRFERYKLLIVSALAACWAALSSRLSPHTSIVFESFISFVNEGFFQSSIGRLLLRPYISIFILVKLYIFYLSEKPK